MSAQEQDVGKKKQARRKKEEETRIIMRQMIDRYDRAGYSNGGQR